MKFKKGFTLIEIIVVIAIMGILTVVIIPSLNKARSRNRDTEKISDIGTIQVGLLRYYTQYGYYPAILDKASTSITQYIVESAFTDPDGNDYTYVPLKTSGGTRCTYYHLGTELESQTAQVDKNDNFDSTESGSVDMNNYVYCGGYTGYGLATGTNKYNVRPK